MNNDSILIVDDDEIVRLTLGRALRGEGYAVRTVENGEEALTAMRENRYDLVITDLKMPGMDGLELLKMTKQINPDTPVFILSGFGSMITAIEAFRSGADDFLEKPCDKEEIVTKVVNSLERQKLARQIELMNEALAKKTARLEIEIAERRQAERALLLERNKLTAIMETMSDGVYIANRQGDIEYINPVMEKTFGPARGRKCYEYFHDRSEACPWCKNKEVFAGKSISREWFFKNNNRYYEIIEAPIQNIDGSISKFEIFHDITERKKAEAELKHYRRPLREMARKRAEEMKIPPVSLWG